MRYTPRMLALLLPWLLPGAQAHRPHDVVTALTSDLARSEEVWAILDAHDASELIHSTDAGAHWDFLASPIMEDEIVALELDEDALYAAGRDGTLWRLDRGSGLWSQADLPAAKVQIRDMALTSAGLLVATNRGLYLTERSTLEASERLFPDEDLIAIASGLDDPGLVVVALSDGSVARARDGGLSFERYEAPSQSPVLDLTARSDRLFVGTLDDGAWTLDDHASGWSRCAPLPGSLVPGEPRKDTAWYDAVSALGWGDQGALLATSGSHALFLSPDSCESWIYAPAEDAIAYGGIGDAQDPSEAFTWLGIQGERALVAGFDGISTSEDGGIAWTERHLLPPDYARGVAFAPDYPEDPRIFVGGYGGGAWWTDDVGASWEGSALGMTDAFSYDIQPGPTYGETGIVYFSGSLSTLRSLDRGRSWEDISARILVPRIHTYRTLKGGIWALGESDGPDGIAGGVAWSDDEGESWSPVSGLDAHLGSSVPRDLLPYVHEGLEGLLLVADQPARLLHSEGDLSFWTSLFEGGDSPAAGAAAWPPGEALRVLFASQADGLLLSEDYGETWFSIDGAPEGVPRQLVMADDGTLFLLLRSGDLYRSSDGGLEWTALGAPFASATQDLVPAPRFQSTGTLLAGTHDGVFLSTDLGGTWAQLPRFQRLEDDGYNLECEPGPVSGGCGDAPLRCEPYQDAQAGLGSGILARPGDRIRLTLQATSLRLLGAQPGDGWIQIWVDGERWDTVWAEDLRIEDLPEGWKDIEFEVIGGAPVHVDAVEAWDEGGTLPSPRGALLLLLPWGLRRARPRSKSSPEPARKALDVGRDVALEGRLDHGGQHPSEQGGEGEIEGELIVQRHARS